MKKTALLIALLSAPLCQAMQPFFGPLPELSEEAALCHEAARFVEVDSVDTAMDKIVDLPISQGASKEAWNYICNCLTYLLSSGAEPRSIPDATKTTTFEKMVYKGLIVNAGQVQKISLGNGNSDAQEEIGIRHEMLAMSLMLRRKNLQYENQLVRRPNTQYENQNESKE